MASISEVIKSRVEDISYQSHSKFTYNYRVEEEEPGVYFVYIINSFADIVYIFRDVREEEVDEDGTVLYSALIDFYSCKITPFEASIDTDYYADRLSSYIEQCELVYDILNSIEVPADPTERIYLS